MNVRRNLLSRIGAALIGMLVASVCAAMPPAPVLSFIAQNPQLIPGSPQKFQYEVWMYASAPGQRMGSAILYNNYNTAVFGTGVVTAGRVTITKNAALFLDALYGLNPANDNGGSRFAFSWTYLGASGGGVEITGTSVLAFTVQITVTGDVGALPGITFQDDLMAGEQFQDDDITPWSSVVGIGLPIDTPLPVQLVSFSASMIASNSVRLEWRTMSEVVCG